MTNEEAREIKKEILKLEGCITVGNTIKIYRVVHVDDVLKIINNHIDAIRTTCER